MAAGTFDDSNEFAQQLFAELPRHYDLLVDLLSFGQNRRWRNEMIRRAISNRPNEVLDVATGTAGVALGLAHRSVASITGIDFSDEMLARGRANVARAGLDDRIRLVKGRAEELPFEDDSFDAITFTYLLRYVVDSASTLKELARVLRPGGVMASLEFMQPPNPLAHGCWRVYTRFLLPAAGLPFGREWFEVGRFLGPSIDNHYDRYPLQWHAEAWKSAGLEDVQVRIMSLGGGLVMWGRKARG